MSYHMYADDTQIYVTFKPILHSHAEILPQLENCLSDVQMWMQYNILKLNDDKTEVIVFAPRRVSLNQADLSVTICNSNISPTSEVRNLGVIFDSSMTMQKQVSMACKLAYGHLR